MNKRWSVSLPIGAMAALMLYILVAPAPKLPLKVADGTYFNPCCSELTLRAGIMSFGSNEVRYAIERDKEGAYVLPEDYVGVDPDQGLLVERKHTPLKLRLDAKEYPTSVSVLGPNEEYRFARR